MATNSTNSTSNANNGPDLSKFRKGREAAKKRSSATGTGRASGGSAIVRTILGKLRDAGQEGSSLTEAELRKALAFNGTASQLRRRIRDAQEVAAGHGDLVFTESANVVVDDDGKERALPRATKSYGIVTRELASMLDAEIRQQIKDGSVDFVYGKDVKETSRQSLQEAVRS